MGRQLHNTYKFGLVLVKRQGRVIDGGAEGALLLQLPLLLLAHCVGLFTVDDALGQDGHLGWLQLLRHLRGDGILMRLGICGGRHVRQEVKRSRLETSLDRSQQTSLQSNHCRLEQ